MKVNFVRCCLTGLSIMFFSLAIMLFPFPNSHLQKVQAQEIPWEDVVSIGHAYTGPVGSYTNITTVDGTPTEYVTTTTVINQTIVTTANPETNSTMYAYRIKITSSAYGGYYEDSNGEYITIGNETKYTAAWIPGIPTWYKLRANYVSGQNTHITAILQRTAKSNVANIYPFYLTSTVQQWTAPYSGEIKIEAWGAQGGGQTGGLGGYAFGEYQVTRGEVFSIYVGGKGAETNGGYNGGGQGATATSTKCNGGGGATDVRTGGNILSNRIIVAAGGGGGPKGGNGGGINGSDAYVTIPRGLPAINGRGASNTAGGVLYPNSGICNGKLGYGGIGTSNLINYPDTYIFAGGGGGGGYYGGSGGKNYHDGNLFKVGGGGGSSYTGDLTNSDTYAGLKTGDGLVIITYLNNLPMVSLSIPSAIFSEVEGYNTISISGIVNDADAGDVVKVFYRIDGNVGDAGTQIGEPITADGTDQVWSGTIDISAITEGVHTLYTWAEDDKGGKSAETNTSFNMDRTTPASPEVTLAHVGWVNTDVTVTISNISDSGGAGVQDVEYIIDGGEPTTHAGASDFTIILTTDGTHTIQARTRDTVGHASSWVNATAQIDKVKPSVNVTGVNTGETYYNSVTPHYNVADEGSGLATHSATLTKDTIPVSWSNDTVISEAGSYVLTVAACDSAGNDNSVIVNFELAAPDVPAAPILTATGSTSISVQTPMVTGADNLKIFRDGVEIQTVSPGATYVDDGLAINSSYSYYIQSVNTLGAQTGPPASLFTLANTPDNLIASDLLSTSFTLTWSAAGNPAGTEYAVSIVGGESVPYTMDMFTYTFNGLTLGQEYDVNVTARNGNNIETAVASIHVITNQAPVVTITSPTPDQAFSEIAGFNTITVTGTVTDPDNNDVTVTATLAGVTKSTVVNSCAGGKTYTLVFDVVSDTIPESQPTLTVVADDGR